MKKLGSKENPAIIRVQDLHRANEMVAICNKHGWQVIVGIEPDNTEDISDISRLLNPPEPITLEPQVGRNESCICGSGKKYKKCCLNKISCEAL